MILKSKDSTSDSKRSLEEESSYNQYHHYQLSDSQSNILKVISQNPGIRYKELARQTGLANGVLTYHLNIIEHVRCINKFRHDKITRYYSLNVPREDLKVISHLRVHSEKDIILFVLDHDFCTFNEIVEHTGKAPSTISWHLKRLCEDGIIAVHHGEYNLYQIVDKKLVNRMLHKYKESFADKVVNNLVDIVDELE
jgi:predicted transcriptional regulator